MESVFCKCKVKLPIMNQQWISLFPGHGHGKSFIVPSCSSMGDLRGHSYLGPKWGGANRT